MACSDDTVRPDTDYVEAKCPEAVSFDVNITFWINAELSALSANIQVAVNEAADAWVLWQKSELGRDINPSELVRRIINAGAKRCTVSSPSFTRLKNSQVGIARNVSVNYGGLEES